MLPIGELLPDARCYKLKLMEPVVQSLKVK